MKLLEERMEKLTCEVSVDRCERDVLVDRLTEFESCSLRTKQHDQLYFDCVQECCMELVSLNVSTQNVGKVIWSVLHKIAGMNVQSLPKPSTLIRMTYETTCSSAAYRAIKFR